MSASDALPGSTPREPSARELFERGDEAAALDDALRSARGGAGRLVLLSGPAGAGKSSLLGLARRQAAAASMTVLDAAGSELEHDFPLGVARQLFRTVVEEPANGAPLGGVAEEAVRLLRSDLPTPDAEDRSTTLIHGLYWLTSDLASTRPLVLVVDDVHWADLPSLRFLLYLARRLDDLPVAVALAARDTEDAPGRELLEELDGMAGVRRLAVRPLSRPAAKALIRTLVPEADDAFADACFAPTGGNPFLLTELASEVGVTGLAPTRESADRVAELTPDAVVRAVARRARRLSPDSLAVLQAVAVLGDDAPLGFVAELAGLDVEAAATAAEPLTELELLEPRLPLRFVHALLAAAVRSDLGAMRAATLHARAAAILRRHGAPPERLAVHLTGSPRTGDPVVVEDLRAASRQALAHGAPGSAARYLRRALAEPPAIQIRGGLLRELGEAEALAGDPAAAERLAEAVELVPDGRPRAETLRALGGVLYRAGRLDEAARTLEDALAALGAPDDELALEMRAEHAQIVSLTPDLREALGGTADPPPPDRTDLTLAERSWMTQSAVMRMVAGERAADVLELAERAYGDGVLLEQETANGTAIYGVTMVQFITGAYARDLEVTSAAVEDARRRGSALAYATATFCRAGPQLATARIPDAIADLEATLDARRHGWRQYLPTAAGVLAVARLEAGDVAGAHDALAQAEASEWIGDIQWGTWLWARGKLHLHAGETEPARAAFARWGEVASGIPNPAFWATWRSHLALPAFGLGDREEARRLAAEEVDLLRAFGAPAHLGAALRAQALVQDDEADRLALLEESVAVLEESEGELERLRSLVELGAALRRVRRPEAAREPLGRALDRAHALGATLIAGRAEDELRATGLRPRRRALTGEGSLTPGERRVTQMAAAGMSNREIAEALFVSPKAVQWHLGNAYRKLGVSSRGELPQALGAPERY